MTKAKTPTESRTFTEDELKEYVYGDVLHQEEGEYYKGHVGMETVFRADDGKLYQAFWQKGAGDYSESYFHTETLDRVYPVPRTTAKFTTDYSTDPNEVFGPKITTAEIKAAPLVAPEAEAAIQAIRDFDAKSVLEFIDAARPALLGDEAVGLAAAAQLFFDNMKRIKSRV